MPVSSKRLRFIISCLTLSLIFGLALIVPSTLARASLNACPPSLQALIDGTPIGGTLTLPACTFTESVIINKDLTLVGDSSGGTILQAPLNQRVITVVGNVNINLQYLSITGGNAAASGGGAIYTPDGITSSGSLQISDSYIYNNIAAYGGGIYAGNTTSSVTISNTLLENNSATQQGGGIYSKESLSLTNANFFSNTTVWHGGGISVLNGSTTINGGSFYNNTAGSGNGGAVNVNNGLVVSGTSFYHNSAGDSGGAITQWNKSFQIVIANAVFHGNTAKLHGGGVYVNSVVTFDHDIFDANIVDSGDTRDVFGGGVYAGNTGNVTNQSAVTVLDSTFTSNETKCSGCAFQGGGGIYVRYAGSITTGITTISRSSFDGNHGWFGAAVSVDYHTLVIDHSTFTNNTGGYGAGIDTYNLQGEALTFQGNHAVNAGGGVDASSLVLSQCSFLDNTAGSAGGSALIAYKSAELTNVLTVHNLESAQGTILLGANSVSTFENVTISQPTLGTGTAIYVNTAGSLHLQNSIITNYSKGVVFYGALTEDHNLLYNNGLDFTLEPGGSYSYLGSDIHADPLFVNPASGNYHLQAGSPAIAGGMYVAGIDVDLDYRPRTPGHSAMGAYNYWSMQFLPVVRR